MTIKEIEKVIDEADVVLVKGSNVLDVVELTEDKKKRIKDLLVDYQKVRPDYWQKNYLYKFNEETGEMTLLAKVDHIDKEKKVIKKKLDEMTEEEIEQVEARICKPLCYKCPFLYKSQQGNRCLREYGVWKKGIEANKDKEFDVEGEE